MIYLYPIVTILVWYITAGWFLAMFQKEIPSTAENSRRSDIAHSWLVAVFCAILCPIGLVLAYLLTGFAEHGWMNPLSFKRS